MFVPDGTRVRSLVTGLDGLDTKDTAFPSKAGECTVYIQGLPVAGPLHRGGGRGTLLDPTTKLHDVLCYHRLI